MVIQEGFAFWTKSGLQAFRALQCHFAVQLKQRWIWLVTRRAGNPDRCRGLCSFRRPAMPRRWQPTAWTLATWCGIRAFDEGDGRFPIRCPGGNVGSDGEKAAPGTVV